MGIRRRSGKHFLSFLSKRLLVAIVSTLLTILFIEVTFRLIGFDFERQSEAFNATPIYYRQPTLPVGEIFFRRPGPDIWRGKVLSAAVKLDWGAFNPYADETELSISYDEQGFRNPADLRDWDIVVVGDSFTELGFLPYEDLFTTRLGKILGASVKNLGASYTGPLTYTFYLKEYGKAPRTKHAIMVFYEGNDVVDLQEEEQALQEFRATGTRPYREIKKQTSFTKALYHYTVHYLSLLKGRITYTNAYYTCSGVEVPAGIRDAPLGRGELTREQIDTLSSALAKWSETARALGTKPWVVYMPCARRVLDGCLSFRINAKPSVRAWRPTDLPELVRELCDKSGIGFIDVTPQLAQESKSGRPTYNLILDNHLNRVGSLVAAQAIADGLKDWQRQCRSLLRSF